MQPKSFVRCKPRDFGVFFTVSLIAFWTTPALLAAGPYYVAPTGSDVNPGNSNSPFATIMRAQSAASAGNTVYLRGGTYHLDNSNITATNNPWIIVNNINKSGISYIAYPGELPVFDFSNVLPPIENSNRVTAFLVTANNCVFEGFDVVGVQVDVAKIHTQSENFRIAGGSFNRFERLRMHDGMGNGWYLTDGASNLVLNCDAYNNRGLDSGSLGNTDGFGCHPAHTTGKGNLIAGCRAWFNSDDGYDCINAFAVVTFSNCWAFYNGYFTNFNSSSGDGNGFKAGGYGVSGTAYPTPIPHHVVEQCLAVSNRVNGFYANHHMDGQIWFNNTAYRNNTDFNMLCNTNNTSTLYDVPGFNHIMKNNLGYRARSGNELSNIDTNQCDVAWNFFTLPVTVAAGDFQSLDATLLTLPRARGGELPYIAFAQLAGTSDLVDAGTNDGFAFAGKAPDLGAFEYGLRPSPSLTLTKQGSDVVLSGVEGPAGGTNYLLAATDLSNLVSWTLVGTNVFDLSGNVTVTNPISSDLAQHFYRVSLP